MTNKQERDSEECREISALPVIERLDENATIEAQSMRDLSTTMDKHTPLELYN